MRKLAPTSGNVGKHPMVSTQLNGETSTPALRRLPHVTLRHCASMPHQLVMARNEHAAPGPKFGLWPLR